MIRHKSLTDIGTHSPCHNFNYDRKETPRPKTATTRNTLSRSIERSSAKTHFSAEAAHGRCRHKFPYVAHFIITVIFFIFEFVFFYSLVVSPNGFYRLISYPFFRSRAWHDLASQELMRSAWIVIKVHGSNFQQALRISLLRRYTHWREFRMRPLSFIGKSRGNGASAQCSPACYIIISGAPPNIKLNLQNARRSSHERHRQAPSE